jgi:hypothetical protein
MGFRVLGGPQKELHSSSSIDNSAVIKTCMERVKILQRSSMRKVEGSSSGAIHLLQKHTAYRREYRVQDSTFLSGKRGVTRSNGLRHEIRKWDGPGRMTSERTEAAGCMRVTAESQQILGARPQQILGMRPKQILAGFKQRSERSWPG